MGMLWRNIMPLLSTLAALVILVHTAEEDLEPEYRDVPAKLHDTGPTNYEQTWTEPKSESMIHKTGYGEDWNSGPEDEYPKRRRIGRRRKRPPHIGVHDNGRRYYHEDVVRSNTEYDYENNEPPKRKRKRPEMGQRWHDGPDARTRYFRRGKRPKLAEYDVYHDEAASYDNKHRHNEYTKGDYSDEPEKPVEAEKVEHTAPVIDTFDDSDSQNDYTMTDNGQSDDEKPSGEMSLEADYEAAKRVPSTSNLLSNPVSNSPTEKEPFFYEEYKPHKQGRTIANASVSLKDILLKSNGSSLSEILQHHNLSLTDLLKKNEKAISVLTTEVPEIKYESENVTDNIADYVLGLESSTTTTAKPNRTTSTAKPKPNIFIDNSEILHTNETSSKYTLQIRNPQPRRKLRINMRKENATQNMTQITNQTVTTNEPVTNKSVTTESIIEIINGTHNKNKTNENKSNVTLVTEKNPYLDIIVSNSNATKRPTAAENVTTTTKKPRFTTVRTTTTEEPTTSSTPSATTIVTPTRKPVVVPVVTQKTLTGSEIRQKIFTNRLKKKRLRQKNMTVQVQQEPAWNSGDLFGNDNLVTAGEFITTPVGNDDVLVTEASTIVETTSGNSTLEETAKFELEELFKEPSDVEKLSKILMERNMTRDELAEHRERGSSNVHLAEIFHNASREPNPPEPFLSKSSIEPISKEIYPLRALLEANSHDTTTMKPPDLSTAVSKSSESNTQVPTYMGFGNNVNENSENLGIMSLFDTMDSEREENVVINKDTEETSPIPEESTTVEEQNNETNWKEGRDGKQLENTIDPVSLRDLFSILQKNYAKEIKEALDTTPKDTMIMSTSREPFDNNDFDGAGVIILEDLQHLKKFDSNRAASEENIEIRMTENKPSLINTQKGILNDSQMNTKSVTVATVSIAGLTMVVFLLTYAAFKWRQQKSSTRKKDSFCEEHIPTPVFESRKTNKNQSSNRSISPMLSSNIYTLNTLDSRNESPDYMWDSLRKPFQ